MTVGRRKDLTDDEKRIIIKELANATTPEVIANRINRHVVTVNKFLFRKRKIRADSVSRKSFSKRDLNHQEQRVPEYLKKLVYQTLLKVHEIESTIPIGQSKDGRDQMSKEKSFTNDKT